MRAGLDHEPPPLAPGRTPVPVTGAPPGGDISGRWRAMVLLLASSLTIMAGAIIAPSLPALEVRFADEENAALLARLVLTMPALFIALCAPLAGLVADRWGRLPLLLGAVTLYGAAGLSGLVLDSLSALLVGRALLGVAVAGVMTACTALVGDYFTGAARSRFMGFQAAFTSLGGIVFLTLGGLLAEYHWRAPFVIYGLALVLLPAIALRLTEPTSVMRRDEAQADVQQAGAALWLGLAAVFLAAAFNSIVFYAIPTQLPFFLRALEIPAPSKAGMAIGIANVSSALLAFAYTRVRRRMSVSGVFGCGFALLATGFVFTAMATDYGGILGAMVVAGAGLGLIMPNLAAAALQNAPAAIRGRVSGGLTASIFTGHFLSPLITQPVIGEFGYATMFAGVGIAVWLVALVALAVYGVGRR